MSNSILYNFRLFETSYEVLFAKIKPNIHKHAKEFAIRL